MKKEIKQQRLDILVEIDRLDKKRCTKCRDTVSVTLAYSCTCPAAVKISKLGDALLATTSESRVQRTNGYIEQLKEYGLTPTLYQNLREHGIDITQMRDMLGWTQKEMTTWRRENDMMQVISQSVPEVKRNFSNLAEQSGLTLEKYKSLKRSGAMDKEIRQQYRISQFALLDFKKRHGLALPRGHNSKYRYMDKTEGAFK